MSPQKMQTLDAQGTLILHINVRCQGANVVWPD